MLYVRDFLTDQTIYRPSNGPETPLVSVILPTYRRCQSGLLRRAIESVLSQTFENFEFIVMDDGSSDGSAELIQSFQANDSRLVHVRHERNCGLPGLRVNEGIELARGQYLAFQFDDDMWRPHALDSLVTAIQRQSSPCVMIGRARFNGVGSQQWHIPSVELNLVTLHEQNRLANNTVLFAKELVQLYGMYDCHIGMRRLCDWDLWLRYVRHVPFIALDETISDVFESNPGSIGLTVPWDLALFRYLHAIPRNKLLTPAHWQNYEVDSLRIDQVELAKSFRRRLYEEHLTPYYLKFRHHFPQLEGLPAFLPAESRSKIILYTKNSYDVSNDVTLGHYDPLANQRTSYKMYYQPLSEVASGWSAECDLLLLVRTPEEMARQLLEEAFEQGVPIGFYLDDDLLTFHEFGPQFDYLAPGKPYYQNLEELLSQVDAVWVTNSFIAESVAAYTPRCLPHNNIVRAEWLPTCFRQRSQGQPFRIGYVGSGYRLEEFSLIWEALRRLSREYGDMLCFEFWGLDISSLPPLYSPVKQVDFTFSYFEYVTRLQQAGFDLILSPLLDQPRPRLGKSLIKYYETAVAGAVGIFSDVPQYESLPADLTCLKAKNTVEAWYEAMHAALTMRPAEFDRLRQRMVAHVREEFTEVAKIHKHEAACRATEFHAKTRGQRHNDGKPRVIYALHSANFGGGEIQLWRRLRLARNYGVEPVVVLPKVIQDTPPAQQIRQALEPEQIAVEFVNYTCFDSPRSPAEFTSELERPEVQALLERWQPALVHTVTFIPTFGQICQELNIPHIASMYAVDDNFSWETGRPGFSHCAINQSDSIRYARRWHELLESEPFCAREVGPEDIFELGLHNYLNSLGQDNPVTDSSDKMLQLVLTGTVQPRKSQLEAIEAVGRLRQEGLKAHLHLYGYTHFFPDYLAKCNECIEAYQLQEYVTFHGFSNDIKTILQSADILLSLSTYESFPSSIKEAMAAGVLVVATPAGGIAELIIDKVSGILCSGISVEMMIDGLRRALALSSAQRQQIVNQAWRVARSEFHPDRAANDLFTMYNRAVDITRGENKANDQFSYRPTPIQSQFPISGGAPIAVRRLKNHLYYYTKIGYPNWAGLSIYVAATQAQTSFKGSLKLAIFSLDDQDYALSQQGGVMGEVLGYWDQLKHAYQTLQLGPSKNGHAAHTPLRTCEVRLEGVRSYSWVSFHFDPIADSEQHPFRIEFSLYTDDPATQADLYLFEARDFRHSPFHRAYHKYLRFGRGGELAYRIRLRTES